MKTYVYQECEVKMTGRIATQTTPAGRGKVTLYEITPLRADDGTWKKWVTMGALFEIQDEN